MALPVVPIVAGIAAVAVLIYLFKDKGKSPRQIIDQAQSAVEDAADAAADATEAVADTATKVASDIKKSVS